MKIIASEKYEITTSRGRVYQRRTWTGGDTPPSNWEKTSPASDLVKAFLDEQIAQCLGLDYWECAGTSAAERLEIFRNRAVLDAWRTMNP